ncbi:MAG: hypothetical protein ACKE8G_02500 [Methylophagaceae bacterium]
MKSMHLDFLNTKVRHKRRSNTVLLLLLLLVAAAMLFEHRGISGKIAEIESVSTSSNFLPEIQAKPTAEDLRKLQLATVVQQKLNLPWQALLTALEKAKKESPSVTMMSIQPDPVAGDVMLAAQAVDSEAMLAFVTSLERQSNLFNVLLLNQRKLEFDSMNSISFTVKMGWEI